MMPVAGRQPKKCISYFKQVQYEKSGEYEPGENDSSLYASLGSSAIDSETKIAWIVYLDFFVNRHVSGVL